MEIFDIVEQPPAPESFSHYGAHPLKAYTVHLLPGAFAKIIVALTAFGFLVHMADRLIWK